MDLKNRKRLSLLILLLGLPGYIVACWWLLAFIDDRWGRMPLWAEAVVIITLGVIWVLPFKRIFKGIGKGEE
ncbi:MAG: DUF2842 domain-containing protein [Paracoccus sp. (in: a-proteobacteria)]|nr:DUF2842 domain-containing protein [Paracoccus sp. (in: a-proteobacteria)]